MIREKISVGKQIYRKNTILFDILLLSLPLIFILTCVKYFGVNVTVQDDYDFVMRYYQKLQINALQLGELFALHVDHPVAFVRVFMLVVYSLFGVRPKLIVAAGQFWLWLGIIAIYFVLRKVNRDKQNLVFWFLPAVFLVLNFRAWEMLFMVSSVAQYEFAFGFSFMALAFCYFSHHLNHHNMSCHILAIICAVFGSLSSGQGLLVWPCLLLMCLIRYFLYESKTTIHRWGSFLKLVSYLIFAFPLFLYVVFAKHADSVYHLHGLESLPVLIRGGIYMLGNAVTENDFWRYALGGAMLVTCLIAVVYVVWTKQLWQMCLPLTIITYAIGNILLVTYGRGGAGMPALVVNRYISFSAMVPFGLYLLLILISFTCERSWLSGIRVPTLTLVAVVIASSISQGFASAEGAHLTNIKREFYLETYETQPWVNNETIYPWRYDTFEDLAPFVRDNVYQHLPDALNGAQVDLSAIENIPVGFDNTSIQIKNDISTHRPVLSTYQPYISVNGWAFDWNDGLPAKAVYVAIDGFLFRTFYEINSTDVMDYFGNSALAKVRFSRDIMINLLEGRHEIYIVVLGAYGEKLYKGGNLASGDPVYIDVKNGKFNVVENPEIPFQTQQNILIDVSFSNYLIPGRYQMFYGVDDVFSEDNSYSVYLNYAETRTDLQFIIPENYGNTLRLDFSTVINAQYEIASISSPGIANKYTIQGGNMLEFKQTDQTTQINVTDRSDPYIVFTLSK
jgi:hypothetical protein